MHHYSAGPNSPVRAKDYPDFIVDRDHGLLLNTNRERLAAYKAERERLSTSRKNKERLDAMENDIQDIKQMLAQLLERHDQ